MRLGTHQIFLVAVRMPDAPKRGLVIRARRQKEAHNAVDVAVALEAPQNPSPNARPVAEPVRLDRRMAGSLGHSRRKLGQVDADAAAAVCLGSCRRCRTDYGSAAVSAARPRPSADVPTLSRATVGAERTVWMQPAALGLVAKGRGDGHGQQGSGSYLAPTRRHPPLKSGADLANDQKIASETGTKHQ